MSIPHLKLTQCHFGNAKEPKVTTGTGPFYLCFNEQWRLERITISIAGESQDAVSIWTAHLHAAVIVPYSEQELEKIVDEFIKQGVDFQDSTKKITLPVA